MTHAEAALLLAALPRIGSTEHNFLPKDTRELLGLKATEAAAARSALATLTVRQRLSLLEAAMPERAEHLWEQGALHRVAERIADAYTRALGRRVALDEDMVLEAEAALKTTVKAQAVLAMFADPDRAAALHNDTDWFIGPHWQVARVPGERCGRRRMWGNRRSDREASQRRSLIARSRERGARSEGGSITGGSNK